MPHPSASSPPTRSGMLPEDGDQGVEDQETVKTVVSRAALKPPRFLPWLTEVNAESLKADFWAGLTGAVIVLPQAIAFAAIAGLPPEYGLYTAMVMPIIAALFGSSYHLVSGPTTAISIVVFASLSPLASPGTPQFVTYALTLTFLAGVYQFIFGVVRLGRAVNFVSHNVIVGFMTGAALLIMESQITTVLGLDIPRGDNLVHSARLIYESVTLINGYAVAIAVVTLSIAIITKMCLPKWPHLLLAMIGGSVFSVIIGARNTGVEYVSAVPASLPPLSLPTFEFQMISTLAPEALAVALLGLIEAVSISRAVATRSGQQINSNQEFIGQGLSNIVGSFFSSYAGSGSFTRSCVNEEAGARTPMSAIFAALLLMILVLIFAPYASYLPKPAMGAVILLVAYNLINATYIRKVFRISRQEASVFLITFAATLFLELEFAIYAGVLLSLTLFLMRTSTPEIIAVAPVHNLPRQRMGDVVANQLTECPQIKIIRIDMSIYFGSCDDIEKALRHYCDVLGYRHVLILGGGVNFVDMAGAEMLVSQAHRYRAIGGGLYFCGVKPGVEQFLNESGFAEEFGSENLFHKKSDAIAEITRRINHARCSTCRARIFSECSALASIGAKVVE